ncbi:hypothetical protein SEA_GAIL_43 [Mycobacterium phage Gail]|uniref:Uncharacterized protein n=1 Tax=Mycobacterium phage Gail TaxID=2743994 RepID=A0A7D5FRV4_9CAUD|nr:hypothetical protein KNV16_gp066 [Mycobacterium phage Gail]QLF84607.1 hypothetical protein SEA_GAIL_43 [Mycobacterium phage Gail]
MRLPTLPRRLFRRRPKQFRYPYGIPRVENGLIVTTYRASSPVWDDGVLHLDDGSTIVYGGREHG